MSRAGPVELPGGEEWILSDGPIAPLTKHARLAAPELQGLQSIAAPVLAFDFLRRLVGAVVEHDGGRSGRFDAPI